MKGGFLCVEEEDLEDLVVFMLVELVVVLKLENFIMLCKTPYQQGNILRPCGQCTYCRVNRRREWAARLLYEYKFSDGGLFLTLTYSDDNLPANASLDKNAISSFMKRLRDRLKPRKIRFYGVGEYGDVSSRPHYHLFLYNVCIEDKDCIVACWPLGMVHFGAISIHSANYIAGYVVKKMTNPKDDRLNGRYPEYSRQSTKPGIGYGIVEPLIKKLTSTDHGIKLLNNLSDVTHSVYYVNFTIRII